VLGPLHVLPDFLLIGVARGGTTAMMSALHGHPDVMPFPRREVHFFDSNHLNYGLGWYRRHFPTRLLRAAYILAGRSPAITGESSPFYLAHEEAPRRVAEQLPNVRLIALLRDPTARAVSHWQLRARQRLDLRPFARAIEADFELLEAEHAVGGAGVGDDQAAMDAETDVGEQDRDRVRADGNQRKTRYERYVARGLYLDQIRRWHAHVPRDRLLIIPSERWFTEPMVVMRDVWRHLGLRPQNRLSDLRRNTWGTPRAIDAATVERLREFYRPHNGALEEYLGQRFDWG
jgi:hypothetical protein